MGRRPQRSASQVGALLLHSESGRGPAHRFARRLSLRLGGGEFLRQPDQDALRPADVAQPVHALIIEDFADHLRTVRPQPFQRIGQIVHREHHPQVAQRVDRGVAVVGDHFGFDEARQFQPAVAVGGAHHRDLDALVAQAGDAAGPLDFDGGAAF